MRGVRFRRFRGHFFGAGVLLLAAALACGAIAAQAGDSKPDARVAALHASPPFVPPQAKSPWHRADTRPPVYSFCGACTDDDACGTGNKCCTGNCTNGQKKCYAVATCTDAK